MEQKMKFFLRGVVCVLGISLLMGTLTAAGIDPVLELKEKIIEIQNKGELGFRDFTMCSNILGYGEYVPMATNVVPVDSEIYFYYEPVNLFTNRIRGLYQINFTQDIVLLDTEGEELFSAEDLLVFTSSTTSPVLDVYATNSLELTGLPPGDYIYRAILRDKLKQTHATYEHPFTVAPRE